jgi:hypothetical protein
MTTPDMFVFATADSASSAAVAAVRACVSETERGARP